MKVWFTCVFSALIFTSLSVSDIRAQSSPDYGPFDPRRYGSPALTDEGIDYWIGEAQKAIEKAQKEIAELEPRRGELSNAEEVIERYRASISEEMEHIARLAGQRTQKAMELAEAGRAADIADLRTQLTTVLEASRFNALFGNEQEAMRAWKAAVHIVTTFSRKFSETCYDQSFDPAFALGLQRQNEMLGTGIDVTPCAKRHYVMTDYSSSFENCSTNGEGRWRARLPGASAEFELELRDGRTAEAEFDFTARTPPPHVWTTRRHYRVQLYTKVWDGHTDRWYKLAYDKETVTSPEGRTTTRPGRESPELMLTPAGPTPKPCRDL